MLDRRRFLSAAAVGIAGVTCAGVARSVEAVKTARLLVGFAPGGASDAVARLLAANLRGYAEAVVVENVPGAGGRLALQALANAPADGTVMALTPGDQLTLFPHLYRNLPYDPQRHFAPVSTVCTVQFLLTVGPAVPPAVDSLATFVDWCRANPRLATYGTPGMGTRQHLIGASLARAAGFEFVHVPYKGAAPALQDQLAGQVAANVSVISSPLPHIQSGRLRALATTAPTRSRLLAAVPTAREAGYPSLEALESFGILLPRVTPAAIVDRLNAAVRVALDSPAITDGLARFSFDRSGSTPGAYAGLIASELANWGAAVRLAGIGELLE